MIGQSLLHYKIVEKLGEGGMGVVYKARDTHLDRDIALKLLPTSDPDRKSRFVREAKAASALNHPGIIMIYDASSAEGTDFIAMEYVPAVTLAHRIRSGLELADALGYAIAIADALSRAHGAGIIHRDLKPANVMISLEGHVKVVDFGLAKLTEVPAAASQEKTETVTELGLVVGTVAYMSPEQAQGRQVDSRSDIFSFGAVLYEMITHQRPFQGGTTLETLSAILREEPHPMPSATPPDLANVVRLCLKKDPQRRFQHMADIKVALPELRERLESGACDLNHYTNPTNN
jgi:eukaryotic-like serine/threonine-protein kinase